MHHNYHRQITTARSVMLVTVHLTLTYVGHPTFPDGPLCWGPLPCYTAATGFIFCLVQLLRCLHAPTGGSTSLTSSQLTWVKVTAINI